MTEHDAGYKSLFSDKRMVADLIRGFVREPWVQELDFETLESVSGSFVSEQFKKRENDVIWRVQFRGDWLYVYLLIEFQSTVDRFMALRLMVYAGLLYQRLIDEKQIRAGDFLPPILPIVLYNGKRAWTAPLEVAELMAECPKELARYRPGMRYFLLEEHARDDAELAGMENLAAIVFRFEKCRTREDFERVIEAMVQWASAPKHRDSVKRLARWVLQVLWQQRLPKEPTLDLDELQECGTMLKEQVKEWERELREEGIQEGIEKGEAGVVLRQLEQKFGPIPAEFRCRIGEADSHQLLTWAERILWAERIEDVFKA